MLFLKHTKAAFKALSTFKLQEELKSHLIISLALFQLFLEEMFLEHTRCS